MNRDTANLFTDIPQRLPDELITSLVDTTVVRIERIVSHGHSSPKDFWYNQEEDEWVVVLQGNARLRFADENEARDLRPGDWVNIPAHSRHRVDSTAPDELTIWLAVFSRPAR